MNNPRTLLITNPRASRVTPATRDLIAHALSSVTKLETAETQHAGHARILACDAVGAGAELVVAVGGDGTVNEVVNGLRDAGDHDAALGVVPSGGADVFARTIGIPHDTVEAADALVRFLDAGSEPVLRAIGSLDERAFLFNAGVGFDAAIVEAVGKHPARKRRYQDAYFVLKGITAFARYPRKRATITVSGSTSQGEHVEASGRLAIVALSDPYTYLGRLRLRLHPNADPVAGMSVFLLDAMPTVRTLRVLARAFRGKHLGMRGVTVVDGLTAFELSAEPPMPAQTDGELAGHGTRFAFRHHPAALRVCVAGG